MPESRPGHDRIEADTYHRDIVPGLLAGERGRLAAAGLALSPGLPPLVLDVAGACWTYRSDGARLRVEPGRAAGAPLVAELSEQAFTDLVRQWRSAAALAIAGELRAVSGEVAGVFAWEPVLMALYQGVPVYAPSGPALRDASGAPVDLERAWSLADTDADLAAFLRAAGVMRVRGVFTAAEVAGLDAEVDGLVAGSRPGDDRTWWAADTEGRDVLCRLVYAGQRSAPIAALADDPRLRRLAGLVYEDLRPSVDRMEGISVLLKPPGRLRGLANIPWHTDCGLGGHPVMCPSVAIGVQLTGSSPQTGCLEAVAGTHGRGCGITGVPDLDAVPHMVVPTEPGDVTVHVADVLHASPAPTGEGGRRTVYVTFHPPALFEHVGPGQAFNDLVRGRSGDQVETRLGR